MKHLVASSIAVPSVPCFHPNLSFLFSMSQGLYTRKTWSTERPNDQKKFFTSATTAWSSQMWFLRLVYNRNACDSREAEFNRKPVKVTIQTLRSSAPHPFLTSLLLKLASGVFSHQTWVLLRWTKTELYRTIFCILQATRTTQKLEKLVKLQPSLYLFRVVLSDY